jgi:hypothetical protein
MRADSTPPVPARALPTRSSQRTFAAAKQTKDAALGSVAFEVPGFVVRIDSQAPVYPPSHDRSF